MASKMKHKSIFLTVGTFDFNKLVETATSSDFCKALRQLGYTRLLLQIGRSQCEPVERELSDLSPEVKFYRLKDSISDDIAAADLIISHAGAGTVLETMAAGKRVLVVINEELQGNHQGELARQLQHLKHLYYCTCSTLLKVLEEADFSALVPFPPGSPAVFTSHLHSLESNHSPPSARSIFLFHVTWLGLLGLLTSWTPWGAAAAMSAVVCLAAFLLWGQPSKVK